MSFAGSRGLSRHGKRIDPARLGLPPDIPQDVRHVVTFKAVDHRQTEMTVTEYSYTSDQVFDLSKAGLKQVLDKMGAAQGADEIRRLRGSGGKPP
jgi:hypothetical protein